MDNDCQVSISELVSYLEKRKQELIRSTSHDGQYSKMIREVMEYWREQEAVSEFVKFDPKEKKELGYWYGLFDDLCFFIDGSKCCA